MADNCWALCTAALVGSLQSVCVKAWSDGSMQANGEGREELILKLCLMGGKTEGNILVRLEHVEEERGRHQDSSFSSTRVLFLKDNVGTMGYGT